MVETVYGMRCGRIMRGIMLLAVLLSFFCAMQGRAHALQAYSEWEDGRDTIRAVRLFTPEAGSETYLLNMDGVMEHEGLPEQRMTRVVQTRFLMAVCLLLFILRSVFGLVLRRFDCRRIVLWENIVYIHRTDGEKGKVLLYT